jgi:hypothetical protein
MLRRLKDELLFLLPLLAAFLIGSAALALRGFVRDHVDPESLPTWIPSPTIEDDGMDATEEFDEDGNTPVEDDTFDIDEEDGTIVHKQEKYALVPIDEMPQIKKALRFVTVEGQEDRHMHVIVALAASVEKLMGNYSGGESETAVLVSKIAREATERLKIVSKLRKIAVLDDEEAS